jgi:hypothetical protein
MEQPTDLQANEGTVAAKRPQSASPAIQLISCTNGFATPLQKVSP